MTSNEFLPWSTFRGDTFKPLIEVLDDNDAPIDITGYVFWLAIKNSLDDTDAQAVLPVAKNAGPFGNPELGVARLGYEASQMQGLSGEYWYDVQMQNALGEIVTLVRGKLTVIDDVTRAIS